MKNISKSILCASVLAISACTHAYQFEGKDLVYDSNGNETWPCRVEYSNGGKNMLANCLINNLYTDQTNSTGGTLFVFDGSLEVGYLLYQRAINFTDIAENSAYLEWSLYGYTEPLGTIQYVAVPNYSYSINVNPGTPFYLSNTSNLQYNSLYGANGNNTEVIAPDFTMDFNNGYMVSCNYIYQNIKNDLSNHQKILMSCTRSDSNSPNPSDDSQFK